LDILITVLSAVLVLGTLIFTHELGHFIAARIFKVKINEFSMGMGPRLLWYDSKKTGIRYSLAMFPLGGFVAMEGESEESTDPNAFDKKPAWQRLIITAAGPFINILTGFVAMIILTAFIRVGSTVVHDFDTPKEGVVSSSESGLMAGDEIIAVNGSRVDFLDELSYEIMRRGNEPCDLLVIREGRELLLSDVVFPTVEQSGQVFGDMDFRVKAMEKNIGSVLLYSVKKAVLIVRMCYESLYDLITGRISVEGVTGPIGLSEAIGEAARSDDLLNLLYLAGFISINLGVMNLLPIPALDGGRSLVLLFEVITKKRIPQRIENAINGVALMLLLGLSVLVMFKDVITIINR
jgi:regulator of sigma E protease